MQETSKLTKKILFFVLLAFMVGYYTYKPYEFNGKIAEGFWENIFNMYFFIVNQTLGIVHEAGHGICYVLPCPEIVGVANGTIFQWLFPLGVGLYYKKQGNKIGYYLGLFFLSVSMQYTAWYISTTYKGLHISARESFLGVDGYHDFYYILNYFGLVDYYKIFSGIVEFGATILMFYAIGWFFLNAFISNHK